jgi:hypothetical protein
MALFSTVSTVFGAYSALSRQDSARLLNRVQVDKTASKSGGLSKLNSYSHLIAARVTR